MLYIYITKQQFQIFVQTLIKLFISMSTYSIWFFVFVPNDNKSYDSLNFDFNLLINIYLPNIGFLI